MKYLLFSLAFLGFTPQACQTVAPVPPPTNVPSAAPLKANEDERLSKASASVSAATFAESFNPEGNPKKAVLGELSVSMSLLPQATAKDSQEALSRVNSALKGQLDEAQKGWDKAKNEAADLNAKISSLEAQVAKERQDAALELKRQVQAARDEARQKAEADQRKLIGWIFYGGGALLIALAAGMLFLASSMPLVGPKATLGVGSAGLTLIGLGIALNELLAHPWVIWVGIGLVAVLLATAFGLALSNHHHLEEAKKP